jgi:hypothetical protein
MIPANFLQENQNHNRLAQEINMSTTCFVSRSSLSILSVAFALLFVMVSPVAGVEHAYADPAPCAGLDWETGPPGGNPVPTVAGMVTDSSGAGAANKSIVLVRCLGTSTIVEGTGVTNSSGGYSFTDLPTTGAYAVVVNHPGTDPSAPQYLSSSALTVNFELD